MLKSTIDTIINKYKLLKENLLKKSLKQEKFWETKQKYLKQFVKQQQQYDQSSKDGFNDAINTKSLSGSNFNIASINLSNYKEKLENKISSILTKAPLVLNPRTQEMNTNQLKKKQNTNLRIKRINNNLDDNNNDYNSDNLVDNDRYKDSQQTINMFKETESKSLDQTKKILYDLSSLMTNFKQKVSQQSEMTQDSNFLIKFIIFLL